MCWAGLKGPDPLLPGSLQSSQQKPHCQPVERTHSHWAVHKNWPRVAKLPEPQKESKDFGHTGLQPQHSPGTCRCLPPMSPD
jgi:hypothetical protein